MASTSPVTQVHPVTFVRETVKVRSALFGLIRWEVIEKAEVTGREVHVWSEHEPDAVIVNGVRYGITSGKGSE